MRQGLTQIRGTEDPRAAQSPPVDEAGWARLALAALDGVGGWIDSLAEVLHDAMREATEVERQAASRRMEMALLQLSWAKHDLRIIIEAGGLDDDRAAF